MNELAADGQYHYENRDLGFSLVLPKDFAYYQTQRTSNVGYTDLEFFVPTSDAEFSQSIPPSYGKPVVVRIFSSQKDLESQGNITADGNAKIVGEKGGKIYLMIFWVTVPSDWKQIWNEGYRERLINNFKIL